MCPIQLENKIFSKVCYIKSHLFLKTISSIKIHYAQKEHIIWVRNQ